VTLPETNSHKPPAAKPPAGAVLRGAVEPVAWRAVLTAMLTLGAVLSVFSIGYGFDRDELYFKMLRPAWGYVDQPALTPLLARLMGHLGDDPWQLRIPATVAAMLALLVAVLITRELGGGRGAQTLSAWGYASAAFPLLFGHLLLTTTLDLVFWPLLCLCVIRVFVREDPRWWIAAGAVLGVATFNKLLIALLVIALLAGLLITDPRRIVRSPVVRSRWLLVGALLAAVLAVPTLIYQATNDWPQITMGRALSQENGSGVRTTMWPYLLLLLGPPLVPIWIAGLVALWRRPQWRALRFLVAAFGVVLVETFLGAGQFYYPLGLLVVVFAIGCVPAADFLARSRPWRRVAVAGIALNAAVSVVIMMPLVPLSALHNTPLPGINTIIGDQVGWPEYAAQVAAVYRGIPADQRSRTAIIATNYGEAGAIVRYGSALGLPRPYSGHNELWFDARPPDDTSSVLVVGGQVARAKRLFGTCTVAARLDNRHDVDNEEQDEPIGVCTGPLKPWPVIWAQFQHYD
jgi:4-amino-4-deoxy-L-arabinose transferase-like glycosyltransferase